MEQWVKENWSDWVDEKPSWFDEDLKVKQSESRSGDFPSGTLTHHMAPPLVFAVSNPRRHDSELRGTEEDQS